MYLFKVLFGLFSVACYTAAQDKVCNPARVDFSGSSYMVQEGLVGSTTKFKNVFGIISFPYNDSTSPEKRIVMAYGRTTPVGDADYAGLPIGSLFVLQDITSTAVTDTNILVKDGSGASNWATLLKAPSTTSVVRTDAKSELIIRGTNSGTGDYRAVYGLIELTHASAGSGDVFRGYARAKGGVAALRGAHLTAEIAAGGSVTGVAAGATCQLTTVAGLTLSAGTATCLDLVSDLSSAVTGMTSTSFIRVSDAQSTKLTSLFDIDASATGIIGATTGGTAGGTLIIKVAGVTKYIQLFNAAS